MIVGVLPTTALAATYNDVKVNGVSLGDGKYLASNSATDSNYSNTEPSSYVAWYKDGTLTLNGYKGTGIVLQGAPAADLIIKLIGDNTITTTTNEVGIQGNSAAGSITITADSGSNGNLTIDMTHSTRPVFGINGYANSVTITGSADVKITAVATATDQESFGIKSSKAVSILDSASVGITCKTPNSTSRSDTCNGIYSDTGVTINTDGTIQIDVHEAGDEAYSYGINSMGTLTLTKVGGMTVKWKKAGVQGSPLLPSSASFDPTAYDTHKDTTDTTNCVATYMPKGTTPTTYTVSFDANGGTGTMADVTGISGEYTLPENGFTAPDGKQFKAWSVGGVEKAVGDKITVTADTTVTAVWETIPAGHTCDIKPVAKVEPSCTEGGKEAYYKCEGCGKFYEDALGTKEITDLAAWGNLAKLGHTESDWKSDKDNHWKECTVAGCGVIIENSKAAHADANNDGKCDTCEYNVGIPTTPGGDKPNDNPQTGDNSMMWLWIALLFVSGFGVVTTTVYTKKRKSVK